MDHIAVDNLLALNQVDIEVHSEEAEQLGVIAVPSLLLEETCC